MTDILELEEVLSKVHSQCLDGTSYKMHKTQGTLDEHYQHILTEAVTSLVTLAPARHAEGLEPIEDPLVVTQTFAKLARFLSITFGKPFTEVQSDIFRQLEDFPVHDYHTAKVLRNRNKLH